MHRISFDFLWASYEGRKSVFRADPPERRRFFQKHRTAYLYFPDGKRRTLRLIAALTAGSQGERRRTEFADRSEMNSYIEEMTEGCRFRELPDGEVSHLYSFVTCSYEFADARTIVYAVDE